MSTKVTVENLDKAIAKILEDYDNQVSEKLDEITKKIGAKGAQALRNESKEKLGTTKNYEYAKGWTYQVTKNRLYTTVTIYNRTPGLPHLLEHGHALVNGGRQVGSTKAYEHILPVEEKLINEYEREVVTQL